MTVNVKDAPSDATHYNPYASLAIWYKNIDGVWHYWAGVGYWKKSCNGTNNRYLVTRK